MRLKEVSSAQPAHWDGSAVKEFTAAEMEMVAVTDIEAMWGDSSNDLWFSRPYFEREYVDPAPMTEFLHWNGTSFSSVRIEESFEARAAWGTSSSDVWFVGGPKKVLRFSP